MSRIVNRVRSGQNSSPRTTEFELLMIWSLAGPFLTTAMGLSATPAAMLMMFG